MLSGLKFQAFTLRIVLIRRDEGQLVFSNNGEDLTALSNVE